MASDAHPESLPEADPHPDSPPTDRDDDARSDIEQAVEARADAIERGDGGEEPDGIGGENGADGEVRDQTTTEQ